MKIKYYGLLCTLFCSSSVFAVDLQCKNEYKKSISEDIVKMVMAFQEGNLQYIESKTDNSLIKYVGGQEALHEILTLSYNSLKIFNFKLLKIETQPPQYSYLVGDKEICFVPKQASVTMDKQIIQNEKSYMLAIRSIDTNEWKYLDGSGLKNNPEMLYTLFPDFPRDVEIPISKK